MDLQVCVLAAGQGKRMRSEKPKVLHQLAHKALVEHVLDTASEVSDQTPIVIYGHAGDQLKSALAARAITWVEQAEQLGTGHAVNQCLTAISEDSMTLILYGDVPLTKAVTLTQLVSAAEKTGFALLTVIMDDPAGYGRIVRNETNEIVAIVEHKDATPEQLKITEVNSGIMAVNSKYLHQWIPSLGNDNAQGEYYLTDCVALAVSEGKSVAGVIANNAAEVTGVNSRQQLAELEREYQSAVAISLMEQGVTLRDPSRIDVRGNLTCGQDVEIDVNAVFKGEVTLGDGVSIGPNCFIENASIGANVAVLANCVIDSATIGDGSKIGPFARVRPDTHLGHNVHIGNFVEVKKSDIGDGSKVNHLAYVGDSEIGRNVNVGAGTITCNYDGAFKHKTVLEDDVFIGSDTQLVAPVKVGRGATVGAGTTVTSDVEPDALVISRVKQKQISGWQRPKKPGK
jgi:bifunctional UDP-N-acetylglucosamine pyrophosphorylase / glucosamine-1-phosphate N-acetyltransferase